MTDDATTPAANQDPIPTRPVMDRFDNPITLRNEVSTLLTKANRVQSLLGNLWRTGSSEAEAAEALVELAERALSARKSLLRDIALREKAATAEEPTP